jgi:hypothetical protein
MRIVKPALLLALVYTAIATPAFAYLDGATGSMILQAVIAGLATGLMFFRTQLARVKNFFTRTKKANAPDAE